MKLCLKSPVVTALVTTLIVFLLCPAPVFAQSEDDGDWGDGDDDGGGEAPIESRWSGSYFDTFSKGDSVFNINIGGITPTVLSKGAASQFPTIGGTLSLVGSYFLSSKVFVGGGLYGMFISTIGENQLYVVPMGPHVGVQWIARRFEFPVSLMAGWAWQSYVGKLYFGPIVKPQAAVLFRAFSNWSFGLALDWWFIPQIGVKSGGSTNPQDVFANFLELKAVARYQF
jgi:hypothetical protein